MNFTENRRVILTDRPKGVPSADYFALETASIRELRPGEFLVRNEFLSVDPAQRGWLNDAPNYLPPVPVGDVVRGFAVGEIVASQHPDHKEGDVVSGMFGWQSFSISDGSDIFRIVKERDRPRSLALGVLGLNGITAYFGLIDLCRPKSGETVVVSTAAGAVGSCVGQIAKSLGCQTVGIAGGAEKVVQCLEMFSYDSALDYKSGADLSLDVGNACPNGVDVYFDNTCGPISDAVFEHLALGARITVCGTAAIQEWNPLPIGPRVHRQILVTRAQMRGLIAFDYKDRYDEAVSVLCRLIDDGKLAVQEHVLEGLEHAPGALQMLYRGENSGKLLIKVD